jgi:hypothetical protein
MKLNSNHKQEIVRLIDTKKVQLGSYGKVADACGVRTTKTISNDMIKPKNWESVSDKMWVQVGTALGYKFSERWVTVETRNLQVVCEVLRTSQKFGDMKCISHPAGGGKTEACEYYASDDEDGSVFLFKCEKWSHREFILRLAKSIGIDVENERNLYALADRVIAFFKQKRVVCNPILIIDQADKLANRSLGFLIQFYNELKNECGCVLVGTDHLAKKIKAGVKRNLESFDELDDRLGRNYVGLIGYNKADVMAICKANGVNDTTEQEAIFDGLHPEQVQAGNKYVRVVRSGRMIETAVNNWKKRELKKQAA